MRGSVRWLPAVGFVVALVLPVVAMLAGGAPGRVTVACLALALVACGFADAWRDVSVAEELERERAASRLREWGARQDGRADQARRFEEGRVDL